MTVIFNVHSNIKAFQAGLSALAHQQLPFATAQALTALAHEVDGAEQQNEIDVLDRPRPFTLDAHRVIPARKNMPVARLVVMDRTARYLEPYEFGGDNLLNGRALLKPIAEMSNLDAYGNLPRGRLAGLKARNDVFIGTVKTKIGPISGVWQRTTDEKAPVKVKKIKLNRKTGRMEPTGKIVNSRVGKNTSGSLKLLIKFTDAHPVRQNLDWFGVAENVVNKRFNPVMGAALARAIASARP